jgi:hypothetical protein
MGPVAPIAAIIIGVGSAATAVVGGVMQYQSGQRQASAAKAQAEAQAAAAAENARQAKVASSWEEYQQRYRTGRLLAEQRTKFGKAGVVMEGTPLAVMEDTAYQAELDALAIKTQGDFAANRYMQQASSYRQSGQITADAYQREAGTSLLTGFASGAGQAMGAWNSWKSYKANKNV